MEKYKKIVDKEKKEILPNEIRVTSKRSKVHKYVKYAEKIINQNEYNYIIIRGFGSAMINAILCAEILKRKICMLHSIIETGVCTLCDVYVPIEDGLDNIHTYKKVCYTCIKLSKSADALLKDEGMEEKEIKEEINEINKEGIVEEERKIEIKKVGYAPPIETHPIKDLIDVQTRRSRRVIKIKKEKKKMRKKKAMKDMEEKQIEFENKGKNKTREEANEHSTAEEKVLQKKKKEQTKKN